MEDFEHFGLLPREKKWRRSRRYRRSRTINELSTRRFQIKIFRGAATEISPSSLLQINEPHKGLITRLNINIIDAEDEALSTLRQQIAWLKCIDTLFRKHESSRIPGLPWKTDLGEGREME